MHCSTTDNGKKPITALETNQSLQSSMLHKITLKKSDPYHMILLTVLYTLLGADMENLFNNQELLYFVIISYILLTLMFDSGVIL